MPKFDRTSFVWQERTKNAQFIIISLRSNMFELADTLVGIYKTNNCTKTATINPSCFPCKNVISLPPSQLVAPRYVSDQVCTTECSVTL